MLKNSFSEFEIFTKENSTRRFGLCPEIICIETLHGILQKIFLLIFWKSTKILLGVDSSWRLNYALFFWWVLDASAAVYASAHDSFAPHWKIISFVYFSWLLWVFRFFRGLYSWHLTFLFTIMFWVMLELFTYNFWLYIKLVTFFVTQNVLF